MSQAERVEVHVAGTCVRVGDSGRIQVLIARRSPDRRLYPGLFEGCGGRLLPGEGFAEGVRRHFRHEFGVDVEVLEDDHRLYEIRVPVEPVIPGVRFLCRWVGGEPRSSNHTEIRWVGVGEFALMPREVFPDGFQEQVLGLLIGRGDSWADRELGRPGARDTGPGGDR